MSKRREVESFILKYIDKIDRSSIKYNTTLYKNLFSSMSDKQFDVFMQKLRDNKITLSMIVPNGGDVKIDTENNLKVGKELGYDFFQRIKISNQTDIPDYITPNKYMTLILPIRRASQLLSKKISIPDNDKAIDVLSGQVTGRSLASKITMPEIQMLIGMGLKTSVRELLKIRGGDIQANNAMVNMLYKTGQARQTDIEQYAGGVVATKTLKTYLTAQHIKSTL